MIQNNIYFKMFASGIDSRNDTNIIVGRRFNKLENFFEYPVPSIDIGIVFASELSEDIEIFPTTSISCSVFSIQLGNSLV